MAFLFRWVVIVIAVLSCVTPVGATPDAGTLSPFISPEECDITLPTEEEAVARLRAIGIPEHSPPHLPPEPDAENPFVLPSIPSGTAIDDEILKSSLVGSVRRFMA